MKTQFLILILLTITATSCTVTKRRYTGGWYVEWNKRMRSGDGRNHSAIDLREDQLSNNEETNQETILIQPIATKTYSKDQINEQNSQNEPVAVSDQVTPSEETIATSVQSSKLPADTLKKRQKWVPYKYRGEQEEAEDQKRIRSHQQTIPNEEPQPRSGISIATSLLATVVLVYFGYGGTILLTAFCLLIFDFTITLGLEAYFASFLLAWIMFAGITSLLLRMWMQPRKDETHKAFKKRLWRYSMLIAIGLALITVIVLGVVMFL